MLLSRFLIFVLPFVGSLAAQPNIVVIIVDDVGWNDVSFHGSKQIPTPNLDVLARDGIMLSKHYTGPQCTPSRGSLMTGKYASRLGLQHYVLQANRPSGLPLHEKLLPQYLKELGYATRGVGKWHLGFFKEDYIPTKRGFDSFFGFWTAMEDYYTHVLKVPDTDISGYDFHDDEKVADRSYVGQYSTEIFTEKAEHIIRNHNYTQPLFLYLAHQAVHVGNADAPLQAPEKYIDPFVDIEDEERRKFAGMLSALDISVGKTIAALDEAQVLDNTIIVFTTDNGGAVKGMMNGTASNYPLRGSKFTLWEGGTRTVSFIWSHELRKNNRVSHELMHVSDWFPTLYSAAGGNADDIKDLDSYNQWPSLTRGGPSPRQEILYNIDQIDNNGAIRNKKYKLIRGTSQQGMYDGWFDREGNNISESSIHEYFSHHDTECQKDECLQIFNSQTFKVLSKNYGNDALKQNLAKVNELVVDCHLQNQDITEPCRPTEKPCLFDIENDPCEFNNLANQLPEVFDEMMALLHVHEDRSIPPGNKPFDPLSDPKLHNNNFVPWQ